MDDKYGLILTAPDVRKVLVQLGLHVEDSELDTAVLALQQRGELRFNPEEPLFILRAKDEVAPMGIEDYSERARESGASEEFASAAVQAAETMRNWQREHPAKIPDSDG